MKRRYQHIRHCTQPVIPLLLLCSFGILAHDQSPVVQLVKQASSFSPIYTRRIQHLMWKTGINEFVQISYLGFFSWLKQFILSNPLKNFCSLFFDLIFIGNLFIFLISLDYHNYGDLLHGYDFSSCFLLLFVMLRVYKRLNIGTFASSCFQDVCHFSF